MRASSFLRYVNKALEIEFHREMNSKFVKTNKQ